MSTSAKANVKYPDSFALIADTRIINYFTYVNDYHVQLIIEKLDYLKMLDSKAPIMIRICSGGGAVDAGLVLYDYIKSSKTPIFIQGTGLMASMAAVLLGAGKKGHRSITKNSRVMIHQPSSGRDGTAKELEIHTKEVSRIRDQLAKLIAKDTRQSLAKVKKDIEADKWMTAEEAVKYGIVDFIV